MKVDLVKKFINNTLFPYMEKKKGNRIREYLNELNSHMELSKDELLDLQREKLKELMLYSIKHVPYYKKYAGLEEEIKRDPFKAIESFAVLNKSDLIDNEDALISDEVKKENLILNHTGGSTGKPTKFYMDRRTVEYYEAARYRGLGQFGVGIGSRSVMIWGNTKDMSEKHQFIHDMKERFLKNRIVIPIHALEKSKLKSYVKKINSYKPEYIYGYSGGVHQFAKLLNDAGCDITCKIKAVVVTSEAILDEQIDFIESVFKAPVVREYGARDAGILAYDDANGDMRLIMDNCYFESLDIVKDERVETGKARLIVTDLNNYAQPRLRYDLSDIAQIERTSQGFDKLLSLDGRLDAVLVNPDGLYVHGTAISGYLKYYDNIDLYKFVQNKIDDADFYIVFKDNKNDNLEEIVSGLEKILPKVNIKVNVVDKIDREKNGKYRYVVRNFKI